LYVTLSQCSPSMASGFQYPNRNDGLFGNTVSMAECLVSLQSYHPWQLDSGNPCRNDGWVISALIAVKANIFHRFTVWDTLSGGFLLLFGRKHIIEVGLGDDLFSRAAVGYDVRLRIVNRH